MRQQARTRAAGLALIVCALLACRGAPDATPSGIGDSAGIEPESAALTVVGPFPDLEPVSAASQPANALASGVSVTAHPASRDRGWIEVRFLYAGEPGSYRLMVRLVAYDEQGMRLFAGEQETVDQRLLNIDLPSTSISTSRTPSPATRARFHASDAELERTARVEVEFRRK